MKKLIVFLAITAATLVVSNKIGYSACEPSTNPMDGACQVKADGTSTCVLAVCNAEGAPCKARVDM